MRTLCCKLPDADLYLVSCVKTKQRCPAPARNLYTSNWFVKARTCVERSGRSWYILSAKYGLVEPSEQIEPYEKTLNKMKKDDRRAWARGVIEALQPRLIDVKSVVFLAGEKYREFLEPALHRHGIAVSVPMEGLRSGKQLAWLKACLEEEESGQ